MKHLKSILVGVLAALVASGCWRPTLFENDFPRYKVNATVRTYYEVNRDNDFGPGLDVGAVSAIVDDTGLNLTVFIWGKNVVASIVDYALEKGTATRYAELREMYGDFNPVASDIYVTNAHPVPKDAIFEDVCSVAGPAHYGFVVAEKICALTITSNLDWDAEHPAGAVLNDLFEIHFDSIYPYVKGGFGDDINSVVTRVKKPLKDLAEDDLWLCTLYDLNNIHTSTLPMVAGTHTIFVTLTLATGEQIEYSTDVTFE